MEVDEIQPHACSKFPRITGNDEIDAGEKKPDLVGAVGRFHGWPSSRIVRVSRASGGKDRHSKVLTCKGLRDRRVRLSVSTAIQFYDLQDRLGYDQPSKAVEWLLKAAEKSIEELPPMDTANFPDGTPKQLSSNGKRSNAAANGFDSGEFDNGDPNFHHHHRHNLTKSSACNSPSETTASKGSVLSLSRSCIKSRSKVQVVENDNESISALNLNPISQTTSFTELLSITMNSSTAHGKWSSSNSSMDYFVNPPPVVATATATAPPLFSLSSEQHIIPPEIQHFSIFSDHHNNGAFNRGTLQSNSSSSSNFILPHLQRYTTVEGASQSNNIQHNQQLFSGLDARLQLYYGGGHGNNNHRQSDRKGSEKN